MVGLLSSLLNPQPQNMAPQPSQPMAGQTQQPRGLLGLGGNLGGLIDFNDPQKLIAMQLIANGQKAPGQMFDGVPELAAYGAKMQQTKAQEEQDRAARNQTAEFLKANDPALASLVESGALTPAQAYSEWSKKQQGGEPNLINAGDGRIYNPATQEWIVAPNSQTVEPLSAMGKLTSDYRAGLIDDEQYKQALADMAPKGMTVESDGAGGFRLAQGPIGEGGVKFTEAQSKDNVFSTRAKGALPTVDKLADSLMDRTDRAADYDPTGLAREWFQSEDYQVAKAAGDEFLQAILRKDTGAAITPAEQQLYGVTYLPQPGDGPEVRNYKKEARQRAVAAIEAGMSPAQIVAQEKALAKAMQESAASGNAPPAAASPAPAAGTRRRYNPQTGMLE